MAIHNPPSLYTEGAERFNSQPAVNFYAQMLARKQAKEDALDEYYRKLPGTINDAGMRDQERPYLNQQVGDAMKFWSENREAMRNPKLDGGKAQLEFEQRMRQARQTVDQSKQLGKKELDLGMMKIKGDNPHIWEDEDILDRMDRLHKPITDPEHQDFDLATAIVPPKPFGVKEQGEFFKTAVGEFKPKKIYDEMKARSDKKSGQIFVPYQEFYQPEQVKTIADTAAKLATENKSAKRFYSKMMHDPEWYDKANTAFQSVYGKNDIVDTPEKAAAAGAIMQAKTPISSGEDIRADSQLAFNRQIYLAKFRHALGNADKEEADLWIDRYVNDITKQAKDSGLKVLYKYSSGKEVSGYKVQADPTLKKALGFDEKNPGYLMATEDGKYIPVYYKTDDNYQPIKEDGAYAVDKERTAEISPDQLKLALGKQTGVKQLNIEMTTKGGETGVKKTIKSKTYTYKGKTFTQEQIEKRAKENNVSIEEYLKKAGIQ